MAVEGASAWRSKTKPKRKEVKKERKKQISTRERSERLAKQDETKMKRDEEGKKEEKKHTTKDIRYYQTTSYYAILFLVFSLFTCFTHCSLLT